MNNLTDFSPDSLNRLISVWINRYCEKYNIKTLVVGISGGIDSSLITRLCERTFRKMICVSMPMWNQPIAESTKRAIELIELSKQTHSRIRFEIKQIGTIVQEYQKNGLANTQLSEGNLRARIRANILYDYAGENSGIVVGTGNKDEDTIGYFTKGGDGLVDLCPLSNIHKSNVYKMAELLNVPKNILEVKPTAELWEGQTDEGELGMNYDEVEWAIKMLDVLKSIDKNQQNLITNYFSEREKIVLDNVKYMIKKNAHKTKYPPIFPEEF